MLQHLTQSAYKQGKRLVAPLMGFPGLTLTKSTVKLAQQNYSEHFQVVKALADAFKPDAMFPLMDLSVEANALGCYTVFPKQGSATVLRDAFDAETLNSFDKINIATDMRLLGYVETAKLMSLGLPSSILRGAYVVGPYTLSALLMGADEAALATISESEVLHSLCQIAVRKIEQYVQLLLTAGVQVICFLEPSAVMLGPQQFQEFSAQYIRRVVDQCRLRGIATVYHICGNSTHLIDGMVHSGVNALSLDSAGAGIDLPAIAQRIPQNIILIGNISPVGSLLHGTPADVQQDVLDLLKQMDPYSNFILSTGCDLPQEIPLENLDAFMRTGRDYIVSKSMM